MSEPWVVLTEQDMNNMIEINEAQAYYMAKHNITIYGDTINEKHVKWTPNFYLNKAHHFRVKNPKNFLPMWCKSEDFHKIFGKLYNLFYG